MPQNFRSFKKKPPVVSYKRLNWASCHFFNSQDTRENVSQSDKAGEFSGVGAVSSNRFRLQRTSGIICRYSPWISFKIHLPNMTVTSKPGATKLVPLHKHRLPVNRIPTKINKSNNHSPSANTAFQSTGSLQKSTNQLTTLHLQTQPSSQQDHYKNKSIN